MACGTTKLNDSARMKGRMAIGCVSTKRIVYGSSTWIPGTVLLLPVAYATEPWNIWSVVCPHEAAGLRLGSSVRMMEYFTSEAVIGMPLLKTTPLRRWKVQVLWSAL